MQKLKPLTVYSASAGSGKTFSLVQSYLKLTLKEGVSTSNFNKIIAMTFTNKAAWEMKARIIDALDLLAFPKRSTEKEQKKRNQLLKITQENVGASANEIEDKAKKVLELILHSYESFFVLTIDKFTLRLIRTFARDLDINDDFEVIMNEDELIENVIDELLSKIGTPLHEGVTKLTVDYAKANLDEGDKWNFRTNLINFAGVLKKEKDQPYIEHILKQSFNNELHQDFILEIKKLKEKYKEARNLLVDFFVGLSLSSKDMPYGKNGLYGYLAEKVPANELGKVKLINKTAFDTLEGTNVKEKHVVPDELVTRVKTFLKTEKELIDRYFLVNTLRKNFHNLALLKNIAQELSSIKERDNIVRISEFNRMISYLLSGENTHYIYERLGTRFRHYLLDEFQDTSRLQWLNLIPLLHDSIAQNYDNLIVGDPKQAIYRFRNGLVEQFVDLPAIYNPDDDNYLSSISPFFEELGQKMSLEDNWRSQKNIVGFNNSFFEEALSHIPDKYKKYYADVIQHPKGSDGGLVSFTLFEHESVEETNEKEEEFILETVRKCEADGFKRGDICLLARRKSEGTRWAKYLAKAPENYKVVSSDSLAVSADKTVQVFVNYLNLRKKTGNPTAQIRFAVSYLVVQKKDPLKILNAFWKNRVGDLDFDAFADEYFGSINQLFFEYENLYDLGQQFSRLLNVSELRNPYLHHIMEMFQNYDLQYGPDLRGFIDFWETKGAMETVQMPENDEAIQIMTVHKAKGLEFPVVILPSLSWSYSKIRDPQFVKVDSGELIHVNLKKEDVPEYILEKYQAERDQLFLDEFNLLYVAVTRPVNRLYGLVDTKLPKNEFNAISNLYTVVLDALQSKGELTVNENTFTFGEASAKEVTSKNSDNHFVPCDVSNFLWFPDMTLQDDEALEKEELSKERRFGNQMHLLLSKVNKPEDIAEQTQELLKNDLIETEFLDELIEKCTLILSLPAYHKCIDNAENILSEQDIIFGEAETKRPDKLILNGENATIIDYKTGRVRPEHNQQLHEYAQVLKLMGFEKINGKILYTNDLNFVDVF